MKKFTLILSIALLALLYVAFQSEARLVNPPVANPTDIGDEIASADANAILYADGAGILETLNTFVFDDALGFMGIGDSSPDVELDVVGDIEFSGQLLHEGANYPKPKRWLIPYHTGIAASSQAFTSTTVALAEFEITVPTVLDGVSYVTGTATSGIVIAGVYGPVSTADTCNGASLLASATSTAGPSANTEQYIAFASPPTAPPGLYYVALGADNSTATYMRQANQTQVIGWGQTITKEGATTTLPATCSSPSNTGSAIPGYRIRGSTP